ncbi:MAG: alpha-N-arabinofuranosidase, partial [Bacteroidales bacterium]|nr:alpha-N-arabinofuranosidase [Bacteroidales bacterium]
MKKTLTTLFAVLLGAVLSAQVKVAVHETATDQPVIPKEIYGQFAEHLGRCIYDGIWVGKDSPIPNVDGYRKDLVDAIR